MSHENLESIRRAFPESGPTNLEALLSILDEQVEWDYVGAFPETTTYRGPEEVREFLAEWSGAFDDFGIEAEEVIDAGESVIVLIHQWGRGKQTGADVESRTWQVLDFRDGKVVHCRGYASRAEAFKAAGLSE
ncbi:MAG: nuclear transport factor 2 family protein [Thermoleophilaceae bacterium]